MRATFVGKPTFFRLARETYSVHPWNEVVDALKELKCGYWRTTAKTLRKKKGEWFVCYLKGSLLIAKNNYAVLSAMNRPKRVG